MDFSEALHKLKNHGHRVARSGWNGKGMHIHLIHNGSGVKRDYIEMFTADAEYVPWVASQTDLLADDWEIA